MSFTSWNILKSSTSNWFVNGLFLNWYVVLWSCCESVFSTKDARRGETAQFRNLFKFICGLINRKKCALIFFLPRVNTNPQTLNILCDCILQRVYPYQMVLLNWTGWNIDLIHSFICKEDCFSNKTFLI